MSSVVAKVSRYWKFLIAALTPVFLAVQAAVTDDVITTQEWVAICASAVIAVGVLVKGNAAKPVPLPPPAAPVVEGSK